MTTYRLFIRVNLMISSSGGAVIFSTSKKVSMLALSNRSIQVGIGIHFPEIFNGQVVFRAFVFQDIVASKNPGEVFVNAYFSGFFDDKQVDLERRGCKFVFFFELQNIFVIEQLHLDSLQEGRVPVEFLAFGFFFHLYPFPPTPYIAYFIDTLSKPECIKTIENKYNIQLKEAEHGGSLYWICQVTKYPQLKT